MDFNIESDGKYYAVETKEVGSNWNDTGFRHRVVCEDGRASGWAPYTQVAFLDDVASLTDNFTGDGEMSAMSLADAMSYIGVGEEHTSNEATPTPDKKLLTVFDEYGPDGDEIMMMHDTDDKIVVDDATFYVVKAGRNFDGRGYKGPSLKKAGYTQEFAEFKTHEEATECVDKLTAINPVGFVIFHNCNN